jgi:hypothetical protein
MKTSKPMVGIWTLTAPNGRTWEAETPIQCVSKERRERVSEDEAVRRVIKNFTPCMTCKKNAILCVIHYEYSDNSKKKI